MHINLYCIEIKEEEEEEKQFYFHNYIHKEQQSGLG